MPVAEQLTDTTDRRITVLAVVLLLFGVAIIFRLFSMQVLRHGFYGELAADRQETSRTLLPERGSIFVRENGDLFPLVTNRDYYQLYAEPNKITSPNAVIDALAPILGMPTEEWQPLLAKVSDRSDPYEPIRPKVTQEQIDQINKLELPGIGSVAESFRYYPEQGIGGHLFGFVGFQGDERIGQYGLEGYFQEDLAGQQGFMRSVKDALGSLITIGPRAVKQAEDGVDLVVTIDRQIQFTACTKLKEFYDWFKAERGSVVILEPTTGKVLAMCSYPDFNPEKYGEIKLINELSNPAIFYDYEPGSVFKTITMAAALNEGAIEPDTTYEDTGEVKVGAFTIRNFDQLAHGTQTMTSALQQSLNTGAMFAAEKIGRKKFRDYVRDFGFGTAAGIELETEVSGNILPLEKDADIYYLTASYGHGITVTVLQLAAAYAAIANDGWLMKPYVVAEKIWPDGRSVVTEPTRIRQVITSKTATLITGMLTSVVQDSYDRKAQVPGYYLAAKTGTALVPGPSGGYSNQTIHTVTGFGPIADPRFVIVIRLDKPQGPRYASDTLTPLFRQLAEYLLHYYQIPPDYTVTQQ